MNILLINSSPKRHQSCTYILAQTIIQQLSKQSTVEVIETDATKLPHLDSDYSTTLCSPGVMCDESVGSLSLSNQLISDLDKADLVIIASPMHNFSLPSGLKSWVDHVVRAGRTFKITSTGKQGLLNDKPVYVLVSSGGSFSGKDAYQPDFFTPYMTEVMATVGLNNIQFFTIEGTAANPEAVREQIEARQNQVKYHLENVLISQKRTVDASY
ncbi:FMN-dependent NADH-azoreductase [Photobacterium atrarenae]|uniref:FMN dependent NADH:quinone oxidoreductase n=1 Tax=Photobacterium atrarenae TaxID=865757 RepID=A0ABY5GQV9_9GAMM|nr:NAD(P)H-dependent oxidoreductase [Photobacterium atrarenae]UTV30643.1 NAD(P)H-dependent oxidoreductase [Photobacterium atrarenae]